jgi:Domain of unknown function (DUF4129)
VTAARAAGLLLAAVLASAAPCGAAAPPGSNPHTVATSVAGELNVQRRLPSEESSGDQVTGAESASSGASAPAPSLRPGNLTTVAAWLAGIFVVLFLGLVLADALRGRRRRELRTPAVADGDDAAGSQRATARASLLSADELAAAGRYTEAIHQLLADAVAMLRRRAGAELSDALTSREVVRALRLPQAEGGALGEITARVEQTWFAQRAAAAEDYEAVRASFRVFTAAGAAPQ